MSASPPNATGLLRYGHCRDIRSRHSVFGALRMIIIRAIDRSENLPQKCVGAARASPDSRSDCSFMFAKINSASNLTNCSLSEILSMSWNLHHVVGLFPRRTLLHVQGGQYDSNGICSCGRSFGCHGRFRCFASGPYRAASGWGNERRRCG
jgi:hypothetical protein